MIPSQTVKKYIREYFDRDKVLLDEHGNINTFDYATLKEIAKKLKVSMATLNYRLNELGLYEIYCRKGTQS